jgi:hypothetical protein
MFVLICNIALILIGHLRSGYDNEGVGFDGFLMILMIEVID